MTMMSSDVPPVIRVGRTKVISGKMPEVRALFHDEVFGGAEVGRHIVWSGCGAVRHALERNSHLPGPEGWAIWMSPLRSEGMGAMV